MEQAHYRGIGLAVDELTYGVYHKSMKEKINPQVSAYMATLAKNSNKAQKKKFKTKEAYSKEMRRRRMLRGKNSVDNFSI